MGLSRAALLFRQPFGRRPALRVPVTQRDTFLEKYPHRSAACYRPTPIFTNAAGKTTAKRLRNQDRFFDASTLRARLNSAF